MISINAPKRLFVNPNKIPYNIALNRLIKYDVNAECDVYSYQDILTGTGIETWYVAVVSTLTEQQITDIFAVAMTQAEINSIPELTNERVQFRDEYQDALNTLQNIIDFVNPTNAQVISAVKYLAKVLKRVIVILARNYK